jgi:polysaccharide biosynthesis/export protein
MIAWPFKTTGRSLVIMTLSLILSQSCVSPNHDTGRGRSSSSGRGGSKAAYFGNIQDTEIKTKLMVPEPIVQKNDLLSITISSANEEASKAFNAPNQTAFTNTVLVSENSVTISGYLVDLKGDIQFPVLGTIHVAGLSKHEVTNMITQQLLDKKLLVDPIVTVRYLNFKVSVLGEVTRPGVITIPNEKVTILEALGLAGDLTIYGKRDNLLLIRELDNGEKIVRRINLGSSDLLTSQFYYLKSNDVIYVEPNKNKLASVSRTTLLLPAFLGGISLLIVALEKIN